MKYSTVHAVKWTKKTQVLTEFNNWIVKDWIRNEIIKHAT